MRSVLLPVLALAALTAAGPAGAAKPETPREVYDRDLTCAAAAAAIRMDPHAGPTAVDREHADKLAGMTRQAALASGPPAGVPGARISAAIDRARDGVLRDLRQPDRAQAAKARTDTGRLLVDCALVHAMTGK